MSLKVRVRGSLDKVNKRLDRIATIFKRSSFDKYGRMGVEALRRATPVRTGQTANSWHYKINKQNGQMSINWYNTNVNKGVIIAVILQYGHGTRNGGYVRGTDYINPAMRKTFQQLADDIWKEVSSA